MTEKSSKLVVAVELLYVLVKCSLHFWGWLVTGGFIYGWVSSHKKLVFCVDHPEALQEKLCRLTEKLPPTKLCEKVLSVGVFLSLAIFLSGAWFGSTSLGLFFKVTGGLSLLLLLLYNAHWVLGTAKYDEMKEAPVAIGYQLLLQTLRPSLLNGFILGTYAFWILLLLVSPLLFFLVAPGGVAYLLKKGSQKFREMEGINHD
ncbi:hypothetical protein [Enterococcus casseliflavus]|uniref:hypothetical protein n=1 Tax=Enterococcus casseliflavus TaxID=37734 RepID=UPI003D0FEFDA